MTEATEKLAPTDDATLVPICKVVARGVGRTFGGTVALRNVDVAFEAGEIVTIEGPNGSGKTTLLGIIGTFLPPTSGEVRYAPVGRTREQLRAQIGWVSHETLAYPDLTARQNVRLAASLYGIAQDAAWDAAVDRFGLATFADRPVRVHSRGQRQRVALARSLVHAPSLLLLDEPTAGLDSDGVDRLLGVIRDEAARGAIVIVVTHDLDVAAEVAHRRVRLERGQLAKSQG